MRPCLLPLVGAAVAACCSPGPDAVGPDVEAALRSLEATCAVDPEAAQRALLEPAFDGPVRDSAGFRRIVGEALVRHGVSDVTLAREDEPGERIEVELLTETTAGEPVPGVQLLVFATDAEGLYHPTLEGEDTPRLFARLMTDEAGRGVVRTVRPGPYPGTRNPRHLHVAARKGELRLDAPGYIVFDDDPLLFEPENEEPRGEALRIRMSPAVDGVARGRVTLPMR